MLCIFIFLLLRSHFQIFAPQFSLLSLQLLDLLRKLDCYRLRVEDLQRSDIGSAVATLATSHPKPDVARLAASLLQKWRDLVENSLFQRLEYDLEAAAAAEDGEAFAPEDLIAAEKEQQRLEKLERRRLRIEEDFMAVSSSEDEKDGSEEEDPEWAPQLKKTGPTNSIDFRRSRSGRQRAVERMAAAAAAAGSAEKAAESPIEISDEGRENAGDGNVVVIATSQGNGNQPQVKECSMADALPNSGASAAQPSSQMETASAPPKKTPKQRPTILTLLRRQAQLHSQSQSQISQPQTDSQAQPAASQPVAPSVEPAVVD